MRVFAIVLGVLMVIFGIICMFTPLATAIDLSYYIVILAAVYGIIGVVGGIVYKYYGIGFVFSILSLVFAIVMLFVPNMLVLTNIVIFEILACWISVMGIVSAVTAFQSRKLTTSKSWIFKLIVGIVGFLIGIYAFLHPVIFGLSIAWIIGILVGVIFVETGFSLMFLSVNADE